MNKFLTNLRFYYKLYYYRFVSPYEINYYNVINKLMAYKKLYNRHSLFENQNYIINQIVYDIRYLREKTTDYAINDDCIKTYIERPYRIEQSPNAIIFVLITDILKNDL